MFDFPKIKTWKGEAVNWLQQKCDGHLCCLEQGHAYTKTQDVDNWEKLKDFDFARRIPLGTRLLGELHCPGVPATSVPTLIKERDSRLQFTPFAIPLHRGEYIDDFLYAMSRIRDLGYNPPFTEDLTLLGSAPFSTGFILDFVKARKWEGVVLKVGHMEGWYKLKPTKTVDAFVYHSTVSTSATRYGMLEALYVGVFDNGKFHSLGRVGGGFSEEQRVVDHTALLNKVVEIEYDCLAGRGRLRFPRFVRWRDDKRKEDCLLEQLQ